MILTKTLQSMVSLKYSLHKLYADWGSNSKFPEFQKNLVQNATSGFISLGLIVGGFILALIFEKKLGWILVLGGAGFLLHTLGIF